MRPPRLTHLFAAAAAVLLAGGVAWAALAPVGSASREAVFDIPRGAAARRLAGEDLQILPQTIHLTLGLKDVLVLRNGDEAPHVVGPALIMPGQSFTLPFSKPSSNSFECTAHASGQLTVVVEPGPAPGWERLRWRWRNWMKAS
jgi:hypothetical protein